MARTYSDASPMASRVPVSSQAYPAHFFDVQIVIFKYLVDVCDFQFATRRRRDIGNDVEHPIVINTAGNSPIRGWVFRFLNNFGGLALVIKVTTP